MSENTERKCGNEKQACVPFFLHENAMMHYNRANKRMLIALIVSVTVLTIGFLTMGGMFISAYNEREKGWQTIIHQRFPEVTDGVHEQPDP